VAITGHYWYLSGISEVPSLVVREAEALVTASAARRERSRASSSFQLSITTQFGRKIKPLAGQQTSGKVLRPPHQ